MSTRLAKVVLKDGGIHAPGNSQGGHRKDQFTNELCELTWNPEARAISIKDRASGKVRIVDTTNSLYWEVLEAKPQEQKK